MRRQGRQHGLGYFTAVVATIAVILVRRFIFADSLGTEAPLSFFLFAVAAAAWLGGLRAGLLATALSSWAGIHFFIAHDGWHLPALGDQVRIAFFFVAAATISWLIERMHRSQAHADQQRQWLQITLDSIGDAVIATDAEGRITSLNPVAAALTGWTLGEAVGRPLDEVFHIVNEQTRQLAQTPVKRVLAEGRIVGLANHTLLIARDGTERPIDDCAAPIRDDERAIRGVVLVFRDITEQRRLHYQLQEADRRKDEFLATLAHELRNPLAAVRNALHIMRLAGDNPTAIEQARPVMERQLAQMVRLVDDLLDVSRIARNKLQLRRERVDLAQIVHHAVETARPLIETAGHQFALTLPAESIHVDADEARLTQVFANLLNNAAKYTEPGGHMWLTVSLKDEGETVEDETKTPGASDSSFILPPSSFVEVRVKDTGVGISADQLPHIFEMFAQVDYSLERSQGGLGIGLTLVKRLTELHGGTVEARSEGRGKGCEFIVRLPVDSGTPPQQPCAATGTAVALEKAARHPCKVLIVDDSVDTSTSMRTLLHIMGHDTRIAHDGLEAVEIAEAYLPHVMLLDISLPKLNGYEVAQRIRRQSWGQAMKLVAVTGWGQEEDKRRSLAVGFDHHITKPVEPAELEELLRKLCPALA